MNNEEEEESDMLMPGFRFHPTEEELVEFYLRRKVEGKPFNVELIAFLDLYHYDPWELPGLAAGVRGEKEWYFYVPRDRKYRNGDRPNRVTVSGYWKATGADRMIRSEKHRRSIGLKKTLVFYTGKAPKGVRTSWIMNEYRLPLHETKRLQKSEISLCRVHKRAGVEDHLSLPRSLTTRPSKPSSSRRLIQQGPNTSDVTSSSSTTDVGCTAPTNYSFIADDHTIALEPNNSTYLNPISSSHALGDLHKSVNVSFSQHRVTSTLANQIEYPNVSTTADFLSYFPILQPQPQSQQQVVVAPSIFVGSSPAAFPDGLMWDSNL